MSNFKESEHPRGQPENKGQFVQKNNEDKSTAEKQRELVKRYSSEPERDIKNTYIPRETHNDVVKVEMDAKVQKQLSAAQTPKERQKIAFRYIMDNLRGKYSAADGRTVAIERVGASKITSVDRVDKLRACPALADMIKAGKYDHSARGEDKPNKKFEEFAYYRIRVKIGDEVYNGMLNVGIRADGSSTLYDLRPFDKESK